MQWQTHQVTNQVPDLHDYNIFMTDMALVEGIRREHAGWHEANLTRFGAELGSKEVLHLGELANRHLP
ncbi:MAG: DNA alkylation response protein, partial [Burkholderiaceae bacterium]